MEDLARMEAILAAALTRVEAILTADPMVQAWRIREEAGLGQVVIECIIRGHLCQRVLTHVELTVFTPAGISAEIEGWLERVKREVGL